MNSNYVRIQKPKRKLSDYLIVFFSVVFAISITSNNVRWINEVTSGLIVLALLGFLYERISKQSEQNTFEIETHYDKLYAAILVLLGIGMITYSAMHLNFMIKFDLEWIISLIIGLFFIVRGFKIQKSLRFIHKHSDVVVIEDYELEINSDIKQIQLYANKLILSKSETENYEFRELKINEDVKEKFETWIQARVPNTHIQVIWNG